MRSDRKAEDGMVTLEAMILLTMALFVMLFFMSFGFLFYQRWTVQHVANDVALRVAQGYAYPEADPVMGFVDSSMRATLSPYRYMGKNLEEKAERKAKEYGAWTLHISSMAYERRKPEISVRVVHDALAQRHLEVKVSSEYEIPFGGALQFFGLKKYVVYEATAYAMCTDISDYINSMNTLVTLSNEIFTTKTFKLIDKVLQLIDNYSDTYNKIY